jgi:hypothetical protein
MDEDWNKTQYKEYFLRTGEVSQHRNVIRKIIWLREQLGDERPEDGVIADWLLNYTVKELVKIGEEHQKELIDRKKAKDKQDKIDQDKKNALVLPAMGIPEDIEKLIYSFVPAPKDIGCVEFEVGKSYRIVKQPSERYVCNKVGGVVTITRRTPKTLFYTYQHQDTSNPLQKHRRRIDRLGIDKFDWINIKNRFKCHSFILLYTDCKCIELPWTEEPNITWCQKWK